jgi:hypothetical protein
MNHFVDKVIIHDRDSRPLAVLAVGFLRNGSFSSEKKKERELEP